MYDHKVEIDELEELEHKQKSDVASVLESDDIGRDELIEPMLHSLDAHVDAPAAADATPAWADNLELANHFADSSAEQLVKHVHDLMADDVAALVQEHVANDEDDALEYEGMIPDFFADTDQGQDAEDKPEIDDTLLVSSSQRGFLEDDDPWNGGGGGGGGGSPNDPPADAPGDPEAPLPPDDPKKKKKKLVADAKQPQKLEPKQPQPEPTRRDDKKGGGDKS